jgi:low affinity Fe/Cu permease
MAKLSTKQTTKHRGAGRLFDELAAKVARWTGRPLAFGLALLIIVVWAVTGPVFQYSDTWQLIINTGTTIVTFLMVFLIQNSQNRDSAAIQVKLDELIRVGEVRNDFVGIEHLTEEEIEELREKCERAAKRHSTGARRH